jgi:chaperonin GroES
MSRNESGISPVEYKVLVRPDPVEQRTESGIIIPDESHERQGWAQVKGTLVARGDSAFQDFSVSEKMSLRPGARVYYDRYQGIRVIGADGEEYALMQDKNVAAVITNEAAAPVTSLKARKKGGLAAA